MHVTPNPQSVADYMDAFKNGTVRVNRDYQRGGGIWSKTAKAFLIETLVLRYPLPAFYLHECFDKQRRRPYRELVDGQQRTEAISEFINGKFRLSKALGTQELRGRSLEQLEEEHFQSLMSYNLPLFHLVDATQVDVREAFRRINSYNATLNAEEKRHATYQGPFKWVVQQLSREVQEPLISWVFKASEINRMKDTAFIAEIIYVYENGIATTKSAQLDRLYTRHENDDEGYDGEDLRDRLLNALKTVGRWGWLPSSGLTKHYQFLVLVLATMHAQKPLATLEELVPGGTGIDSEAGTRLSRIVEALDDPDAVVEADEMARRLESGDDEVESDDVDLMLAGHLPMVKASQGGTNTVDSRTERFKALYAAISKQ